MTCVIVNDASCLIDLHKGGLLPAFLELPYRIVVPLPVRQSEFLDLSSGEWVQLEDAGMEVHDLTPDEIGMALALKKIHPGLSANDCICFVTASIYSGVLLTGDSQLRSVAESKGLLAHGVLWVVDELISKQYCDTSLLAHALKLWLEDERVFLPRNEICKRLKYFDTNGY